MSTRGNSNVNKYISNSVIKAILDVKMSLSLEYRIDNRTFCLSLGLREVWHWTIGLDREGWIRFGQVKFFQAEGTARTNRECGTLRHGLV